MILRIAALFLVLAVVPTMAATEKPEPEGIMPDSPLWIFDRLLDDWLSNPDAIVLERARELDAMISINIPDVDVLDKSINAVEQAMNESGVGPEAREYAKEVANLGKDVREVAQEESTKGIEKAGRILEILETRSQGLEKAREKVGESHGMKDLKEKGGFLR